MEPSLKAFFRKKIRAWSEKHLRDFPWRNTTDPYEILVAEMMLQQTGAETVEPVFKEFIDRFTDLGSLADADYEEVDYFISKIGLNYRTDRLLKIAKIVDSEWQGQFPDVPDALKDLPGVGDYIAHSILTVAFDIPQPLVDTNFVRLFRRFFGFESEKSRARMDQRFWDLADSLLPEGAEAVKLWNWSVLDFASAVCTAKNPDCQECPLQNRCDYGREKYETEVQEELK